MTMATMTPADQFAALWPSLKRYAGKAAGRLARDYRADRDDLFQAGTMAVWRACSRGRFEAEFEPLRLAVCIAKRGMQTHARGLRRHLRTVGAGTDELAGMLRAGPDPDSLAPADDGGFAGLLALARQADRELLTRRFRDGETDAAIAERAGVTRQAVQQQVAAAVEWVRQRVVSGSDRNSREQRLAS